MPKTRFFAFYIAIFILLNGHSYANPPSKILTIASGTSLGNYFKVGNVFCRLVNVNNTAPEHIIRCISRSTSGTVDNIEIVVKDRSTVGIGQLDTVLDSKYSKKLRFVLQLYSEPVFILASKNSNAKIFNDVILQDRINVGSPHSGENATAMLLMRSKNWKNPKTSEYGRYEIMSLLCSNRVDISFFVSANPSDFIFDTINQCDARLIPFSSAFINYFLSTNKGFEKFIIPKNTYPNQTQPIDAIATQTILFAQEDTSPEMVESLLDSIFLDFPTLQNSNSSFADKDIDDFFENKTGLETHSGAIKFIENFNQKKIKKTPK